MKTVSVYIGGMFVRARDLVARGLVRMGVTPNMVTVFGMAASVAGAALLALGRPWWTAAGFVLLVPGACDMLDGAVARVGGMGSRFGGILDSTCDRVSDVALFSGMGYYYVVVWPSVQGEPVNLTYGLLAILGALNATLISYIRARAKHEIPTCEVGFWQRGERYAGTVIGVFAHNVPMLLWELGIGAGLTALQRLLYARRVLEGREGESARGGVRGWLKRLVFFDRPRGTLAYDLYTGTFIVLLVAARIPETDIVRRVAALVGG